MSFSSLYKFVLKLKGRGHFLSPKEVEFLKKLLAQFPEEEIKQKLEKCFKELIPPSERERSSLLRCKRLFETPKEEHTVYFNPKGVNFNLSETLKGLEKEKREKLLMELKEYLRSKGGKVSPAELRGILKVLLRKYL
jgi:hypothetical protein